jgi:branched-chain amino acid aminotransferase
MNLFIVMKNEKGEKELVTPPLDGSILPGVTRDSIIQLAKDWEPETGIKVVEKKMTMPQLRDAIKQKRIIEMFGAGTACIVSPIKCINYEDEDLQIPLDPQNPEEQAGPFTKRVNQTILDIQYGDIEHPWSVVIN